MHTVFSGVKAALFLPKMKLQSRGAAYAQPQTKMTLLQTTVKSASICMGGTTVRSKLYLTDVIVRGIKHSDIKKKYRNEGE